MTHNLEVRWNSCRRKGEAQQGTPMRAACVCICLLLLSGPLCSGAGEFGGRQPHRPVSETWWSRWVRWWHGSQLDHRSPGHLWDPYLPRTRPDEAEALAAAAAGWDAQLPDSFLQEQGDKDLETDWVVPQGPEGLNWTARNESEMTPLINMEIMWLLKEAEDRLSNASGVPFAIKTARRLASYNSAAYCTHEWIQNWNCTRCHGNIAGMEVGRTIYDEGWDLFGYTGYSPQMNAIIVAFKGTDSHSIYNWAENMHYWKTDYQVPFPGAEGAAVHTGFFISYNSSALQPNVTESVGQLLQQHPDADLYVIGHSMGAAMAHVCVLDLKFRYGLPKERVYLYTFGSPRIGNDIFARFLEDQLQGSIRVTHNRDIVPSVPPMWVGFHHVATEVWQVDFDVAHVLGICDSSGEDPLCHNSVCFLGLCTSVADHLLYLGAKMYHRPEAPC